MSLIKIENPIGECPHMKWWFVYDSESKTRITDVEYCDDACYVGSKFTLVMFSSEQEAEDYIEDNEISVPFVYDLDAP